MPSPYSPECHFPSFRATLFALPILLTLIAVAYQEAPQNGFHFDDYDNIVRHESVRMEQFSVAGLIAAGTEAFIPSRPLPSMTFALDWWRGKGDTQPFQWTNLAIHFANASLLFTLFSTLLLRYSPHLEGRKRWVFALLGAGLWAVHPIQIQGVTYIVQRMASMATLFTLLSVWSYIRGRSSPNRKILWYLLSTTAFLCGAFSKENAWIVPLLLLFAEYGVCRHRHPLILKRRDWFLLALPPLALILVIIDLASNAGPLSQYIQSGYERRPFGLEERLLTQPRVILFYLSQALYPHPERFSIEHGFAVSSGFLSPPSTLPAILFLITWSLAGMILLLKQRLRIWGFFMLWVPATLAVESSAIPLEMVFEHRMYLPMAGLTGLLALGISTLSLRSGWLSWGAPVATLLFLIGCLYATLQRIPEWRTDTALFEAALRQAPNSGRVWANLSLRYAEAGEAEKSQQAVTRALELNPQSPHALEVQGLLLMDNGRLSEAQNYFSRALSVATKKDSIYNHWGELLVKLRQYERARQLFSMAIQLEPWISVYHWNIAVVFERLGECSRARTHWERFMAMDKNPGDLKMVQNHLAEEHDSPGGKCSSAAVSLSRGIDR